MPNISSGQISLGNINTQFGRASNSQISMGTAPIAVAGGGGNSTPTSMSGFYYTQTGTQSGSKLLAGTGANVGRNGFGTAIGISSDGNTMVVGASWNCCSGSYGTAWTYARSGNTWTQQGCKLPSLIGNICIPVYSGNSIAFRSNTIAIGYGVPVTCGVYISTVSGNTWTPQGIKLTGTGNVGNARQGNSVALSSCGNTLAVGGPDDNTCIGATWIFTRSGNTWTQQGSKLVGNSVSGTSRQGNSVALSSCGNTLAVGGPNDNTNIGATWIFTRSGNTWTQQGSKLVGNSVCGTSRQGNSVSLGSCGNTLAVGGSSDNTCMGATWIFTRSGNTWTQQGSKLVGNGVSGISRQGSSVALSSCGNTLAVGGTGDNSCIGATWIFTRSGNTWTQQCSKLVGNSVCGTSRQGSSVALSLCGNKVAIGGPNGARFFNYGAVWVFARSGNTWTQQGNKVTLPSGVCIQYISTLGTSVSFGNCGNVIVSSAPTNYNPSFTTVALVRQFGLCGNTWTKQGTGPKISGNIKATFLGQALSVSSCGNTMVIASPYTTPPCACFPGAWVFTRSGNTWTQQTCKLMGIPKMSGGTACLISTSMSANGNLFVMGCGRTSCYRGSAFVFAKCGNTWAQQGCKLVGSNVACSYFGTNVSLCSLGDTLAVSEGSGSISPSCGAWIFTRSGNIWTKQGSKLIGTGNVGRPGGRGVALSADGNTMAVGGIGDNSCIGATWIFTRSGNTWTQQGSKLVGTGYSGTSRQGFSVALSADGNDLVVGGPYDNTSSSSQAGANWRFTRSGNTWTQQGSKLVGSGANAAAYGAWQGIYTAISGNGGTIVTSGSYESCVKGAVWTFK